jgi:hypothetical protein
MSEKYCKHIKDSARDLITALTAIYNYLSFENQKDDNYFYIKRFYEETAYKFYKELKH